MSFALSEIKGALHLYMSAEMISRIKDEII